MLILWSSFTETQMKTQIGDGAKTKVKGSRGNVAWGGPNLHQFNYDL